MRPFVGEEGLWSRKLSRPDVQTSVSKALQLRTKAKCAETVAHSLKALLCAVQWAFKAEEVRKRRGYCRPACHCRCVQFLKAKPFFAARAGGDFWSAAQFIPAAGKPPFISSEWIPNLLEQTEKRPSEKGKSILTLYQLETHKKVCLCLPCSRVNQNDVMSGLRIFCHWFWFWTGRESGVLHLS